MSDQSTRAPRVIFVNRFYWPEEPATGQLLTDLAERLAHLGREVVVITSHPGRAEIPTQEKRNGVSIVRLRGTRWSGGLMGKAISFFAFLSRATLRLNSFLRRGDIVVAMTDPPLLGIGARTAARMRGARLFHWVQDIYPELAIELAGQHWLRLLRPLRNAAWRAAERNVTLGVDMAAVLREAQVPSEKISISANWAPAGVVPVSTEKSDSLRAEWKLQGKFVALYSGNFGRVHDLEPLLAVARMLLNEPDIVFLFAGNGPKYALLRKLQARFGLTNVIFQPHQPRSRLNELLALGDVHFVTLRAGCEHYVFPSKLYGIAAAGRPVIFLGPRDCEVARSVEENGFGFSVASDRADETAAKLLGLKGDPAMRARFSQAAIAWTEKSGGLNAAATQWNSFLDPR